MGIYRDNLSAIVISDNFLPIIVIAQNNFDLSINRYRFCSIFDYRRYVIAVNDFLCLQCSNFKVGELALGKKYTVPSKSCCNFRKISLCFV